MKIQKLLTAGILVTVIILALTIFFGNPKTETFHMSYHDNFSIDAFSGDPSEESLYGLMSIYLPENFEEVRMMNMENESREQCYVIEVRFDSDTTISLYNWFGGKKDTILHNGKAIDSNAIVQIQKKYLDASVKILQVHSEKKIVGQVTKKESETYVTTIYHIGGGQSYSAYSIIEKT